jgi:hypothetical protein
VAAKDLSAYGYEEHLASRCFSWYLSGCRLAVALKLEAFCCCCHLEAVQLLCCHLTGAQVRMLDCVLCCPSCCWRVMPHRAAAVVDRAEICSNVDQAAQPNTSIPPLPGGAFMLMFMNSSIAAAAACPHCFGEQGWFARSSCMSLCALLLLRFCAKVWKANQSVSRISLFSQQLRASSSGIFVHRTPFWSS